MDDMRYNLVPSDDLRKGDLMIIRERIRDFDNKVIRDTDFSPEYYAVRLYAEKRLDELNGTLL